MKNRYEEVKQELLKQCAGNNGESCGGDPSVGIHACRFYSPERGGCALKTDEYAVAGLNGLAEMVHKNALDHGWWDDERTLPEILVLCVSELSEALGEYREGKPDLYYGCTLTNKHDLCPNGEPCEDFHKGHMWDGGTEPCRARKPKPEGVAVELADCIIRILDYCGRAKIDIERAIRIKHEYNTGRDYRHGGKRC